MIQEETVVAWVSTAAVEEGGPGIFFKNQNDLLVDHMWDVKEQEEQMERGGH